MNQATNYEQRAISSSQVGKTWRPQAGHSQATAPLTEQEICKRRHQFFTKSGIPATGRKGYSRTLCSMFHIVGLFFPLRTYRPRRKETTAADQLW
jgi:hypothetical protein